MSVKIGHASIDENGKSTGGTAGDQTGAEVCTRNWYAKGWNKLIRPKKAAIAEKIAAAIEAACKNDNIGYDQTQRTTLYTYAKAAGWNITAIATPCECDCSSLVAVCVNAAGVTVSKDIYTGNQASALKATGEFDIYTDSKYLIGDNYLQRGDILLKEGSHTAVVLSSGSAAGISSTSSSSASSTKVDAAQGYHKTLAGTYKTTANLNMRNGAGTSKCILTTIQKGQSVRCYGYYTSLDGTKWLYVVYGNYTGFCSIKYLSKA